uniref:Uncharacterized protein n=1 Tax=Anoplophora glabripennis TaxID=217634 RepID=V5GAV4_ANOGL
MLMFGRNLETRLDLIRPSQYNINQEQHQKQIDNFNGKQKDITLGDSVFVKEFSNTSENIWMSGKIVNQVGNVMFDADLGGERIVRRHSNQLKKRDSVAYPLSTEVSENDNEKRESTESNLLTNTSNETILTSQDNNCNESSIIQNKNGTPCIQADDTNTLDKVERQNAADFVECSHRYFLRNRNK